MSFETIQVKRDGAAAHVVLHRPDVRNAMNGRMIAELTSAFEELGGDNAIRAVVLRGADKVFCAGADIGWMRESADKTADENREETARLAGMLRTVDECPKPVIGQAHGAALGGAAGLLAACDIVVAAEGTKIGFTEVRLGILPAAISTFVIAKIGRNRARRFFLTAEIFGANKGKEIGLVHEAVPIDELAATVDAIVSAIMRNGPNAIAEAKKLIRDVTGMSRDEAMAHSAETIARVRTSPEGQEGLRAFLEKRDPAWIAETEGK